MRAQGGYGGGYTNNNGDNGSYIRSMTDPNGRRSYIGGSGGTRYFVGKNGYSVMTTR